MKEFHIAIQFLLFWVDEKSPLIGWILKNFSITSLDWRITLLSFK